jgi:hypothetical protein
MHRSLLGVAVEDSIIPLEPADQNDETIEALPATLAHSFALKQPPVGESFIAKEQGVGGPPDAEP